MASWRQSEQDGWGRPTTFNRESSVRQIAPGLMVRDRGLSPTPEGHYHPGGELYNPNDLHSVEDGLNNGTTKQEHSGGPLGTGAYGGATNGADEDRRRKRKKWLWIGLGVLLLLLIVIIVPVAVVKSRDNQSAAPATSEPSSPTNPDGSQPTPSNGAAPANGAIKGSGIGASDIGDPSIVFFQHTDGDIWQTSSRGSDSNFKGKVVSGGDIRNGTPIAAIQYTAAERNVTHIAYIGKDNILRDSLQYNGTGAWSEGRLKAANFEASSSARVGLSLVGLQTGNKQSTTYPLGSVQLYYGGTDGRIHEVSISGGASPACATGPCIDINNPTWREQFVFPDGMNGNAGFYVAQPHEQSYMICSTVDNKLAWFHKQTYPADTNQWASGPTSDGSKLADNTSVALAGDSMVFFQDSDNEVKAIDFHPNPDPQNPWGDTHDVAKGAANTRMVGMLLNGDSTPGVILQAENNSVTQYARDGDGWKNYVVPVN